MCFQQVLFIYPIYPIYLLPAGSKSLLAPWSFPPGKLIPHLFIHDPGQPRFQVPCVKFVDIPQGGGTSSSRLKPLESKENLPSGNSNWEAAPLTWKEGAARWESGYSLGKQVIG